MSIHLCIVIVILYVYATNKIDILVKFIKAATDILTISIWPIIVIFIRLRNQICV